MLKRKPKRKPTATQPRAVSQRTVSPPRAEEAAAEEAAAEEAAALQRAEEAALQRAEEAALQRAEEAAALQRAEEAAAEEAAAEEAAASKSAASQRAASKSAASQRAASKSAASKSAASQRAASQRRPESKGAAGAPPASYSEHSVDIGRGYHLANYGSTYKQCIKSEIGLYFVFIINRDYLKELAIGEPLIEPLTKPYVFEEGVYTWVLLDIGEGKYRFLLKKTSSGHELGTKHFDIFTNLFSHEVGNLFKLKSAGELSVDGDGNRYFNLESGTYMNDMIIKKIRGFYRKIDTALGNKVLTQFVLDAEDHIKAIMKTVPGLESVEKSTTGKTFIDEENPILTEKEIEKHIDVALRGNKVSSPRIKIYWFNNKDECDDLTTILNKRFSKKGIKEEDDVDAAKKTFEENRNTTIKGYDEHLVVIEDGKGGYVLNTNYTTAVAAAAVAAAAAGRSGSGSASIGGGALITRRHRLRGRTRKIKRKRTTNKKKNKRNKRSNKRKKDHKRYFKYT